MTEAKNSCVVCGKYLPVSQLDKHQTCGSKICTNYAKVKRKEELAAQIITYFVSFGMAVVGVTMLLLVLHWFNII